MASDVYLGGLGSNLDRNAGYPHRGLYWFSSDRFLLSLHLLSTNHRTLPAVVYRPLTLVPLIRSLNCHHERL